MTVKTISLPALPGIFGRSPSVRSERVSEKAPGINRKTIVMPRGTVVAKTSIKSHFRSLSVSVAQVKIGLTFVLIAAAVALLIAYIFGINQSAAKGYEIKKATTKLQAAQDENKKLMVKMAEVGSFTQIQDQAASRHLVQISNQEYIKVNHLTER